MSYIVDLSDGRSYFIKLECYEEIFIYQSEGELFTVEIRDCRRPFKKISHGFKRVEKFCVVSEK